MCPISTPPSHGQPAARVPVVVQSRSVRFGPSRPRRPMPRDDDETARDAAEAVARRSYGKLVAFLAARTGDVAGAEDALSDAFAAALVDWPTAGVPQNPEAWLMTVARRKQIDAARRRRSRVAAGDHLRPQADA